MDTNGVYRHQNAHTPKSSVMKMGALAVLGNAARAQGNEGREKQNTKKHAAISTAVSFWIVLGLDISLRLGLSGLLMGRLELAWTRRVVDFNRQLVDQRSQQGPSTGGHDRHPPPTIPSPAKTGCVRAFSLCLQSCARHRGHSEATDVKTSAPQPRK